MEQIPVRSASVIFNGSGNNDNSLQEQDDSFAEVCKCRLT